MLVYAVLHDLGSVARIAQVRVDPADHLLRPMAQLTTHGVEAHRRAPVERLQPRRSSTLTSSATSSNRASKTSRVCVPNSKVQAIFWAAWIEQLATVRVLDPACGSGAFLVEAFDQLQDRYENAIEHLVELTDQPSLFDPDRTILQQNLFGVDLNEEAVEICRLSIWIKTAKPGKVLADLNENIRVGNSVVSDPPGHPRALGWASAFPQVHAAGGFDLVESGTAYPGQIVRRLVS
jgi:hypothetical protein